MDAISGRAETEVRVGTDSRGRRERGGHRERHGSRNEPAGSSGGWRGGRGGGRRKASLVMMNVGDVGGCEAFGLSQVIPH